jgi:hypothetical protein
MLGAVVWDELAALLHWLTGQDLWNENGIGMEVVSCDHRWLESR